MGCAEWNGVSLAPRVDVAVGSSADAEHFILYALLTPPCGGYARL